MASQDPALPFCVIRSDSHSPTKFSGRFPANSNPLESWQEASGIWDRIGQAAAGQTTSATKVRRVDIGGCGPALPFRPSQPRRRGDWACSVPS